MTKKPTTTKAAAKPRASTAKARTGPVMGELGVAGLKQMSGVVQEEFLRDLRGPTGVKVYQEMTDNDPVIGAFLTAIDLMIRAVEWRVEPVDDGPAAQDAADYVQSLTVDMSHTWEDFLAEVMTMLPYGWAYFETVFKRRIGPDETDPKRRSMFSDGRIGIRKIAPRAQDTLDRWIFQPDGGIDGMVQWPPFGGPDGTARGPITLPIEKCLLFRTTSHKNNPEGYSVLRRAYRPWYFLKVIQEAEAIGIERELAGLPVISIPNDLLVATDAASVAARGKYEKMARDLKFNEQAGAVIPSDVFMDAEGKPSAARMVTIELLSASGQRAINTNEVAIRYQRDMARSFLADFLMLGTDGKGSYALSTDKTELFLQSCQTVVNQIAAPINRFLIPRLWRLNGMDRAVMPQMQPGRVAPVDLEKLTGFIERLSRSGATLFPDEALEDHLRDIAGLPAADVTGDGDAG